MSMNRFQLLGLMAAMGFVGGFAAPARAATLNCTGSMAADASRTDILVQATVVSAGELTTVAYVASAHASGEKIEESHPARVLADPDYKPRMGIYRGMSRFLIDSGAYDNGELYLMLPHDFASYSDFRGYLSGIGGRVNLRCSLR